MLTITLDTVVSKLKEKESLPALLEVKHYASLLQQQGAYEQKTLALNAIAKKFGYRKFNDFQPLLEDKGTIVEFEFNVFDESTYKCQLYLDLTYETINSIMLENSAHLVFTEDELCIKFNEQEYYFFLPLNNFDTATKIFQKLMKKDCDIETILSLEDYGFDCVDIKAIKPKSIQSYEAVVHTFDYIHKNFTLEMEINFGQFTSLYQAQESLREIKINCIDENKTSKLKITTNNNIYIINEKNIIFKKRLTKKEIPMGDMIPASSEIIDYSLELLSSELKENFSDPQNKEVLEFQFQIISQDTRKQHKFISNSNIDLNKKCHFCNTSLKKNNYITGYLKDDWKQEVSVCSNCYELKNKKEAISLHTSHHGFFHKVKDLYNQEKSLIEKSSFEAIADDIIYNKKEHTWELNFSFYDHDADHERINKFISLLKKNLSKTYAYNIKLTSIDSHDYISMVIEFCQFGIEFTYIPQDFIYFYCTTKKKYIYKYKKESEVKDNFNQVIRFGDRVKDYQENTYLVDIDKDTGEFFLSCNEDLNKTYLLNEFKKDLMII